jgi:hypothetical protein
MEVCWISTYCLLPIVDSGQVLSMSDGDKHGIYHLALAMIVGSLLADIRHVVTDYVHICRIDSLIVESEILGKPGASVTRVKRVIHSVWNMPHHSSLHILLRSCIR